MDTRTGKIYEAESAAALVEERMKEMVCSECGTTVGWIDGPLVRFDCYHERGARDGSAIYAEQTPITRAQYEAEKGGWK